MIPLSFKDSNFAPLSFPAFPNHRSINRDVCKPGPNFVKPVGLVPKIFVILLFLFVRLMFVVIIALMKVLTIISMSMFNMLMFCIVEDLAASLNFIIVQIL